MHVLGDSCMMRLLTIVGRSYPCVKWTWVVDPRMMRLLESRTLDD
jgi:hypothetical protein